MKETFKEVGKKLLSIGRLISFLPVGFLGGVLFRIIFIFVIEIITSFSPFGGKLNFDDYWRGGAIWAGIITWASTYFISYFIKPRFVSIKQFIICWSFVIGIFAAMTINNLLNPPYEDFPLHKDIFKTVIPLGVLVWIVKDKKNGIYNLEAKRNKE